MESQSLTHAGDATSLAVPLIMRVAPLEHRADLFAPEEVVYDPVSQQTQDPLWAGPSTACNRASYNTPRVGKNPEADRAMDD